MSADASNSSALKFRKRKKRKRTLKPRETINVPDTAAPDSISPLKEEPESKEDPPSDNVVDDDDFLDKLKAAKSIHRLQFHSKNKGLVFEENHEFTTSGLENPDTFRHVE